MQNAGDYLTDVGFRPEGDTMVRDLTKASQHSAGGLHRADIPVHRRSRSPTRMLGGLQSARVGRLNGNWCLWGWAPSVTILIASSVSLLILERWVMHIAAQPARSHSR
jgi:hypothetical protein